MRHNRKSLFRAALSLGLMSVLAACADSGPTAPQATTSDAAVAYLSKGRGRPENRPPLLVCPGTHPQQASGVIDARGGTLSLGSHRMVVPEGAVREPTEFTMTVPTSRYMELDIRASGQEHYVFERPVSVVIDYTRCRDTQLLSDALSVWYIDGQRKEPVEDMGGVDDRSSRRVMFTTTHLSSYAIAY